MLMLLIQEPHFKNRWSKEIFFFHAFFSVQVFDIHTLKWTYIWEDKMLFLR